MRGMGEKQLEIDKRLLRSRMAALRRNLDDTRRYAAGYEQALLSRTSKPK